MGGTSKEATADGRDGTNAVGFDFLGDFPPDFVADLVSAERPEMIALIVIHSDAGIARQLVAALPPRVGYVVACVVSEQELRPRPGVVRSIARQLEGYLERQATKRVHTRQKVFTIAEALYSINGDVVSEFVDRIRRVDTKLAEELSDYVSGRAGTEPGKEDGGGETGAGAEPEARSGVDDEVEAIEEDEWVQAPIGAAAAAT